MPTTSHAHISICARIKKQIHSSIYWLTGDVLLSQQLGKTPINYAAEHSVEELLQAASKHEIIDLLKGY